MYLLLIISASQFSLSDQLLTINEITLNLNTGTKLAFALKKVWQIFWGSFGEGRVKQSRLERLLCVVLSRIKG